MLDRFTDRARKTMQYARQEAEQRNQAEVSLPMIFIGLLRAIMTNDEALPHAFQALGTNPSFLAHDFRETMPQKTKDATSLRLPINREAETLILSAIKAAEGVKNGFVDNECLLFRLLECDNEALQTFFRKHNLTAERLKSALPQRETATSS